MEAKLLEYLNTSKEAGCSKDQMRRFLRAGYVAQPKQLQVHANSRKADNGVIRYIGCGGTRGQAKSHAVVCQLWLDDMKRFPGLKALYLRKIKGKANETLNDMRRKILPFTKHDASYGTVNYGNGSVCKFGGYRSDSEIDSFLGVEYDVILIEDAQTISEDKFNVIDGSLRTSRMDGFKPRMYLPVNPGGVGHKWIVDLLLDENNPESVFTHFQLGDNVFIDEGYEKYLKSLTGWMYQAWALGDFNIPAGIFFKTFSEKHHVFKYGSFTVPRDWYFWLSMDYGYSHYNVAHLIAMNESGHVYFLDEYAERFNDVETNAFNVKQMLVSNGDPLVRRFIAGSDLFSSKADGRSIADEYMDNGLIFERANTNRIAGASKMLSLLGDPMNGKPNKLLISDKCTLLIDQLQTLVHDPKRPEDVLKDNITEVGTGGDDAYDCARYGIMIDTISVDQQLTELLDNYRG